MKIVEIIWIDSLMLNSGEWIDTAEALESMKFENMRHKTVGYLVAQNEYAVCIATSVNDMETEKGTRASGCTVIPLSAITKRTVLKGPK